MATRSPSDLLSLNQRPLSEAATAYASAGWPVLPLRPREKVPITLHGLKDASSDLDRVQAWWAQSPDANIGLRTGELFDVLDVDGSDGATLIQILSPGYRHDGPVSATGKGWHLLFEATGRPNGTRLLDKVDFRGTSGYIVAPPSVHPTGTRYHWARGNLHDSFPPAPTWLLDLVTPPAKKERGNGMSPSMAHAIDLLDIVEEFQAAGVELKKVGPNYKATCPWHPDDTPSLMIYTVDPADEHFHCFGCRAWGDALDVRHWADNGTPR